MQDEDMAKGLKVDVIMRETIKPFSPTPLHLKCFKLSLFDQIIPSMHISLVLFYPFDGDGDGDHVMKCSSERSQRLKKSLSETLTRFYPLAGRIKDDVSVDCTDDGADYLEARVNCRLFDILGKPDAEVQHLFLPTKINAAMSCPLLLVQANFFECGGMAIGVLISHKLADAVTLSTFIKAWAAITTESSSERVVFPGISMASLFPPRDLPISMPPGAGLAKYKGISRRFVFEPSKIAALKAKAASASVPQPTRVEALSALIWKCAVETSRSKSGDSTRRSPMMSQTVSLRRWIVPPLPEYSLGNLIGMFVVEPIVGSTEMELKALVGQLRKGKVEFSDKYAQKLQGDGEGSSLVANCFQEMRNAGRRKDVELHSFTSVCRISFYGAADFGWGKPRWVVLPGSTFHNYVFMMDTRDGEGIEAWVTLSEEDMAIFEHHQELLTYASLNPSPLNMGLGH